MNIREQIDRNDMSPFQVTAVVICILAGLIAGFAILILPMTAPAIAEAWTMPPDQLGTLLSASLAGMMLGAIVIAPTADRFGRRNILLFSMTLITVGLLASGYSANANMLMIARLVTGLGIGGSVASINTLIAEYCSDKRRDLAIGIYISGGALSGILGGGLTAFFVAHYDWSAAFVFGAAVSALMTIGLAAWLPESVDYLLARRPSNALTRINKLLGKMQLATLDALPEASTGPDASKNIWVIFSKPNLSKSVLIWISIFAVFTGFYFFMSWTPKLLVDAGWTLQQAILATVVINVGGVLSGFGFGYLSQRIGHRRTIRGVLVMTAVSFGLFGLVGDDLSLRFVLPLFLGLFLFGTLTSQYALLPRLYETSIRNTGTGWGTGIGRLGAMAAPFVAGKMLAAGWEGFDLYYIYAFTYLLSLVAVSLIWARTEPGSG
jgi:benzoate transport